MRLGVGQPVAHAVYLQPGEYVRAVTSPSNESFGDSDTAVRTLEPGYRYWSCSYVTSPLGGIRHI